MDHPSSESLAAYLDRRVSDAERQELEQHLAGCDSCRAEVAVATRVLSARARPGRIARAAGLIALAAAVLLVVRTPVDRPATMTQSDSVTFRSDGAAARIEVISPSLGSIIAGSAITFRWRGAGDDRLYRVSLIDAAGDSVWAGATGDTSLPLPTTTSLAQGASYVWYVDAIAATGDSSTSGPITFEVR